MNSIKALRYLTLSVVICGSHGSAHGIDLLRHKSFKLAAATALFFSTGSKIVETSATSQTLLSAAQAFEMGIATCGPTMDGIAIAIDASSYLTDNSLPGTIIGGIVGAGVGITPAITTGIAQEFAQTTTPLDTLASLAGCYSGAVLNLALYKTLETKTEGYFI